MPGEEMMNSASTLKSRYEKPARFLLIGLLVLLLGKAGGCTGGLGPAGLDPGTEPPFNLDDDGTVDDAEGNVPVVILSVSNPTPQLNEEVLLICSIVSGDTAGVTFEFQPTGSLSFVDRRAGTAILIVEQTDIGVALTFTCTATGDAGTSAPSRAQVITPT